MLLRRVVGPHVKSPTNLGVSRTEGLEGLASMLAQEEFNPDPGYRPAASAPARSAPRPSMSTNIDAR